MSCIGDVSLIGSEKIKHLDNFLFYSVECGFLCYAIDIDTSKIRCSETHNIYSYFD
jgi:hypothetical protein